MLEFAVPSMAQALVFSESGIIAEFKRRSPSKGWIKEEGRADEIPLAYQQAGAAAISILTDEHFFGGRDEFITTARHSGVQIPVLYKNFVIDEYQLLQARLCGASAVLLIAACLTRNECSALIHSAHELGLEVLLEMHAEEELEYAELSPDLCTSARSSPMSRPLSALPSVFIPYVMHPFMAVLRTEVPSSSARAVSAFHRRSATFALPASADSSLAKRL